MPSLIIDHREISVPGGTKVIEAAERLGIMIPRFCYHPALGSLGACRMCAVKFVEGPVKGLEMSCMVEVEEGMVVSTTDPEAMAFRRWIIECLMLNHPHDCPVCDEGGHCLLQDETVSGGHGLRRYMGKKRTYEDQYLGPFVQHEMNRCIQCWRCRRFYQEFSGYRDLGALGIANRTYFGRFSEGPLESPFSGNLIDICPTGVFTDKPSRFRGRYWDFERGPSICLHCSLGCNTAGSACYREMVRLEARLNEEVNGYFICDRGRFGFQYVNHPDRPREPKADGREVTYMEAVRRVADRLQEIHESAGPTAVACLGSPRNSLETMGQLARLCRTHGWIGPGLFLDAPRGRKTQKAVSRLDPSLAVSLKEVEEADFILVVGADPVSEAPMLALAMRQAQRKGAAVAVLDPRPLSLPLDSHHLAVPPSRLNRCLLALMAKSVPRNVAEGLGADACGFFDALLSASAQGVPGFEDFSKILPGFEAARRPVIVCGTDIVEENTPALAADYALLMKAMKGWAGLFYVLQGPNGFGAALFSNPDGAGEDVIGGIEQGKIKALVMVENDPFGSFPDRLRLERALDRLDFLVVLDYLPSPAVEKAHVVLPTATVFEADGRYVNQEGRPQAARAVYKGGTPIARIGKGGPPPRGHLDHVPGGGVRAAGEVLSELAHTLQIRGSGPMHGDLSQWAAEEIPSLAGLLERGAEGPGRRWTAGPVRESPFSLEALSSEKVDTSGDGLELILVDWTFGTEELSSYSAHTREAEGSPYLALHPKDAARLGLSSGERVVLHLDGGPLKVDLRVRGDMAQGVLVLPRHRQLDWQKVPGLRVTLPANRIERIRPVGKAG
jgi:NADH-quinone oxidoreductase subunit G